MNSEITDELLAIAVAKHPTPWRVERDWGYEVLDANDQRVGLYRTAALAGELVDLASLHVAEQAKLSEAVRQDLQDMGIDPSEWE